MSEKESRGPRLGWNGRVGTSAARRTLLVASAHLASLARWLAHYLAPLRQVRDGHRESCSRGHRFLVMMPKLVPSTIETMLDRLFCNARPTMQRGLARRSWRQCVALLTVLSFIFVLATSATHHHSTLETHNCALCSALLHQVADLPSPPLGLEPTVFVLYRTVPATPHLAPYVAALLLPPSCGPPSTLS